VDWGKIEDLRLKIEDFSHHKGREVFDKVRFVLICIGQLHFERLPGFINRRWTQINSWQKKPD
jgi:hypothetical protein